MLIQNIALVPEAGGVTPAELLRVSAALQKQVGSHFGPCWGIQASVDPFMEIEQVPAGYVPIVLSAPENAARALDISLDPIGQPYARVALNAGWSLAASRACLELLVNPFGQRTISATSPRSDQGPAEILVEVCGAFGEMPTAYAVNDVAVSDFCTPAFFRPAIARGSESYSFRGSLGAPLSLLRGGHVGWFDPVSNSWWLRSFHDEHPSDRQLGPLQARGRPLRELILRHEPPGAGSALSLEPLDARIRWQWLREQATAASVARAQRLRQTLGLPARTPDYGDEEDEEETVAMAISTPSSEPGHTLRSSPPPMPVGRETSARKFDTAGYADYERERGDSIMARHKAYAGSVIVAARDISASSLERRDTLPLTQLLPQPTAPASEPPPPPSTSQPLPSAPAEPGIDNARPNGANAERPVLQPLTAERPLTAARAIPGTVSHSSIPPIAMLAEPPRNEGSRMGLMIAGASVAALVTVAMLNAGTRTAAHGTQPSSSKPAAVAAKADTGKQEGAAPAIPAPAPMPAVEIKPPEPVVVASTKLERPGSAQPAPTSEAQREREQVARERRRREREGALSEQALRPSAEPEGEGERTAAIENLLDTRR
jgi:hypothetical protein